MAALEDLNGVEETFRKQPTIHITGFGSFEGVPENPTEELLSDAMRSDLLKRVQASVVLLPVSHECVDLVKSRVLRDRENKTPQILVHLGVNTTANSIHLERCAHNEASFSCKDNSGWKPQREAIDERLPFAHELGTSVDVESLVNRLRELGHNCRASGRPGTFVCNYLYFTSLRMAQELTVSTMVLFAHVPLFSVIPKEDQQRFLGDLITELVRVSMVSRP